VIIISRRYHGDIKRRPRLGGNARAFSFDAGDVLLHVGADLTTVGRSLRISARNNLLVSLGKSEGKGKDGL